MHSSDVFKPVCNLEEFPEKSAGSLTVRPNWRLFIVGLRPNRPVTAPPAFTDKRSTDNVRQKIIAHEALFQAVNRVKIFKFDWHALFHIPGMTIALFKGLRSGQDSCASERGRWSIAVNSIDLTGATGKPVFHLPVLNMARDLISEIPGLG